MFDGRAEGLPGWTVDRYGPADLIQSFGPAEAAVLGELLAALGDRPVVLKERGVPGGGEGRVVQGSLPAPPDDDPFADRPGRLVIVEDGARLGVDLLYGVNTGLFLDARPMRAWVRQHSADSRVLNLFSYTAGFGVAAARGGARSTTNIDLVPSALDRGKANYALNDLPIDARGHVRSDVFQFLKKAQKRDTTWDLVIVDPPPVPTRGRGRGRKGFDPRRDMERLLTAALAVCAEGGTMLAMSAARGTAGLEDPLARVANGRAMEPLARAADFPGEEGLRAFVVR